MSLKGGKGKSMPPNIKDLPHREDPTVSRPSFATMTASRGVEPAQRILYQLFDPQMDPIAHAHENMRRIRERAGVQFWGQLKGRPRREYIAWQTLSANRPQGLAIDNVYDMFLDIYERLREEENAQFSEVTTQAAPLKQRHAGFELGTFIQLPSPPQEDQPNEGRTTLSTSAGQRNASSGNIGNHIRAFSMPANDQIRPISRQTADQEDNDSSGMRLATFEKADVGEAWTAPYPPLPPEETAGSVHLTYYASIPNFRQKQAKVKASKAVAKKEDGRLRAERRKKTEPQSPQVRTNDVLQKKAKKVEQGSKRGDATEDSPPLSITAGMIPSSSHNDSRKTRQQCKSDQAVERSIDEHISSDDGDAEKKAQRNGPVDPDTAAQWTFVNVHYRLHEEQEKEYKKTKDPLKKPGKIDVKLAPLMKEKFPKFKKKWAEPGQGEAAIKNLRQCIRESGQLHCKEVPDYSKPENTPRKLSAKERKKKAAKKTQAQGTGSDNVQGPQGASDGLGDAEIDEENVVEPSKSRKRDRGKYEDSERLHQGESTKTASSSDGPVQPQKKIRREGHQIQSSTADSSSAQAPFSPAADQASGVLNAGASASEQSNQVILDAADDAAIGLPGMLGSELGGDDYHHPSATKLKLKFKFN